MITTSRKTLNRRTFLIGSLSTLLLCMSLFAVALLIRSNHTQAQVKENCAERIGQITDIQKRMALIHLSLARTQLNLQPDDRRQQIETVESHTAAIHQIWATYSAAPMSRWERHLARTFEDNSTLLLQDGVQPMMEALRADNRQEAQRIMQGRIQPVSESVNKNLAALIRLQTNLAQQPYFSEVNVRGSQPSRLLISISVGLLFSMWFSAMLFTGVQPQHRPSL